MSHAIALRPGDPTELQFDGGAWPQVGAVLRFRDSSGPRPVDWRGGSRWDADGSAVLIAPRHALTIRHVTVGEVGKYGKVQLPRHAIFFPSVGLVPVDHGWVTRGEETRDRLLILRLAREVPLPPITASKVEPGTVQAPQAVGFGDWTAPSGDFFPRGVQRRLRPTLLTSGCTHDLCWNAESEGSLGAGLNNSGGPLIERRANGHQVVAILRRVRDDIDGLKKAVVVSATAISLNRAGWIYRTLYDVVGHVERPQGPPPVLWKELVLDRTPLLESIPLPRGTAEVRATLSAGRRWNGDLLLQMRLLPGPPEALPPGASDRILAHVARDPVSPGEFLARSLHVEGEDAASVAIAPTSPPPGQVRAQLCLRFLDARGEMLEPATAAEDVA